MKNLKLAAALILSAAIAFPMQAQQSTAVTEAKAVISKTLTALNSGDYKTLPKFMADDIEVFTGVYTPLAFIGKGQWMAFINGLANYSSANYDQRELRCRAYGSETVLCNAYFVFTTVAKNGTMEVQSGRESSALVKQGGNWVYANMHYSGMFAR